MTHLAIFRRGAARLAIALALAAGAVAPAGAQSLLASRGLGLAVEPASARSGALGGVTLGLPGSEISWSNPAGAVGLPAGGLLLSFQFDDVSTDYAGIEARNSTARFPLLQAAFPFGSRWAVTAGFGGFLDQNWRLQRADSFLVDADTQRVVDRVSSEGGVARLRGGAGYRLLDDLSIGLGAELFTGSVVRTVGRIFLPGEIAPRCCTREWGYSGVGAFGSVDWNPSGALSLSVGGSAGGKLEVEPVDTAAESRSYSIPPSVEAGVSARVAPALLLVAGADWTGWSSLGGALADAGGARDAWSAQGGLEWDLLRVGTRVVPLRLGARAGALPFRGGAAEGGDSWSSERVFTGGTGFSLGGGAARADLGVERGERSGEVGLDESYWRIMLSVSVLGQ